MAATSIVGAAGGGGSCTYLDPSNVQIDIYDGADFDGLPSGYAVTVTYGAGPPYGVWTNITTYNPYAEVADEVTNYQVIDITYGAGLWQPFSRNVTSPPGVYTIWVTEDAGSDYCYYYDYYVWLQPSGRYEVQLSAPVAASTVEEGASATYELNVTNAGNNPDNVTFAWYPPAGWTAAVSADPLPLGAGETGTINVTITAPHNAQPLHTNAMTIWATSVRDYNQTTSITFNTTVAAQLFAVDATREQGNGSVVPGGSMNLTVRVANSGNNRDNISFTLTPAPAGWSASLSAPFVILDAGKNQTVTVAITAPLSLTGATTWAPSFTATAGDGVTNASALLSAAIILPDFAIAPADIAPASTAPTEGDSVDVDVTVRNLGTPLAVDIVVRLSDGQANLSKTLSMSLSGTGVVTFTWLARAGASQLTLSVDATNAVPEQREDNNAASASVSVTLANVPPAAAIVTPLLAVKGQPVVLSAGTSTDEDGTVTSYYFDFGDGKNSGWVSTSTVTHTYQVEGSLRITVMVKDDDGALSQNATTNLQVTAAAQTPRSPGFESVAALGAVVGAGALMALRRRGRAT